MTTPPASAAAPIAPVPAPGPTHGCVRCGRPVPIDIALCDECNPLGLKQPAPTQVHAIAAGGIVLFVLFLAVVGRVAIKGIGPFSGEVRSIAMAAGGVLNVTLAVTNHGDNGSATTCRIVGADREAGGPSQLVQTPNVPAGQTIAFIAVVGAFGDRPLALAVDCQSP